MRNVGTIVRGIRTPIIKENDNLANIVVDSVLKACETEKFELLDKDVIAVTEAVVGISEGNYATVDNICEDIKNKFKTGHLGVVFPILSRNRFSMILKALASANKKITLLLSYPADEVGNHLFDEKLLFEKGIDPYTKTLNYDEYKSYFKGIVHEFTGIDYVDYYKELIESEDCEAEIIFSNNPKTILNYTNEVLACDIHTRFRTKQLLNCLGLDDILTESIGGSGYNPQYGLLGSNKSTDERLKLFPKGGEKLILDIQKQIFEKTGKNVEVMVYGDGAFKDPVGKIWELADPVVSPFYTSGLKGTPNEIKLKYVSDNKFADLRGEELELAIRNEIKAKDNDLKGKNITLGTTPRQITDLLGSLCDLTSGSGDKGTPVVLVQRYFTNYAEE